ncbi:glycosyltransferase family 4 protein [Dehalococcoidia bacterium]|nr:glycosyltransferase family 4 protein [Dehalococcoidia bacterium]
MFIAVGMQKGLAGGDVLFIEIGKWLLAEGHNVTVVTSEAGKEICRRAGLNANFGIIDKTRKISGPLLWIVFTSLIRSLKVGILFANKRFVKETVIFATSDLFWEVFPLLFIRDKRVIRVASFHMVPPNPFKGYRGAFTGKLKFPNLRETLGFLQHRLSLLCFKYVADIIFAQSNIWRYLVDKGIPLKKIVPESRPIIRIEAIYSAIPKGENYDACWVGRYHPQKGCDDLIEIWKLVCQKRNESKLIIIGTAGEKLKPMITKKGLEENIMLAGFPSDETKFKIMKESKLLVLPSYYEGNPVVLYEAIACGLPVIAYNLPIYEDLFSKAMIKVPIGDKVAFAAEVLTLLEDKSVRELLSNHAKEVLSQYNPTDIAERFLTMCKKWLRC